MRSLALSIPLARGRTVQRLCEFAPRATPGFAALNPRVPDGPRASAVDNTTYRTNEHAVRPLQTSSRSPQHIESPRGCACWGVQACQKLWQTTARPIRHLSIIYRAESGVDSWNLRESWRAEVEVERTGLCSDGHTRAAGSHRCNHRACNELRIVNQEGRPLRRNGRSFPPVFWYDGSMATAHPVLNDLLDPLGECMTAEFARRIVDLRAPATVQHRIEKLAEKSSDGSLTNDEREE